MEKVDDSEKGALGISCKDVSSEVSESYDIPQGVYVAELTEDGAAQKAGIEEGDIITEFDGKSVSDTSSLLNILQYYEAGKKVELKIMRRASGGYEEKSVSVTLDKADTDDEESSSGESSKSRRSDNSQEDNSVPGDGSDDMEQFLDEFFR